MHPEILFIGLIVVCVWNAWLMFMLYRAHQSHQNLSLKHDKLQQEYFNLIKVDLMFEKSQARMIAQLTSIDSRVEQIENQRVNDGGYQQALKMLQMGANKQDIIATCHLSHAEADLLMNLYAYQSLSKQH